MAQIVEYCLVVLVSTFFVAGSIATYNSFSSFESGLQFRAAYAAITGLVSRAVTDGSSGSTLSLPGYTVRCVEGLLSVSSGSLVESQSFPVTCNFTITIGGGPHFVGFSRLSSNLVMSVS